MERIPPGKQVQTARVERAVEKGSRKDFIEEVSCRCLAKHKGRKEGWK
jgi:hypothetical protein